MIQAMIPLVAPLPLLTAEAVQDDDETEAERQARYDNRAVAF